MSALYGALVCVCTVCLLISGGLCACPCEHPALCKPITNVPKKEIFVFSVSESVGNWNKYNWSQITTVVKVGTINSDLMCLAHKHGARIVTMLGYGPTSALSNATQRQIWVKKQVHTVQQHYYDGINFDVESPISPTQKAYRDGYTALVVETAAALRKFNPYAQVTADVSRAPNSGSRHYDYAGLAGACDFLLIMDYDEWGGEPMAWANSPYHYTLEGILLFLKLPNVTGSKLVMGAPWYGYDYSCHKMFPRNTCVTLAASDQQVDQAYEAYYMGLGVNAVGVQVGYSRIVILLENSTSGRIWDESSQSPYFNYKSQHDNKTHQMWYDDHQSLVMKFELVNSLNLRGAGMWHADTLDYSDTPQAQQQRTDMWGAFSVIHR